MLDLAGDELGRLPDRVGCHEAFHRHDLREQRPAGGSEEAPDGRLGEGEWVDQPDRLLGPDEDQRRKYYRITAAGRASARAETLRLMRIVAVARDKAILRDADG